MSNYLELLERQEWKNKRLEILQRDTYQCQVCLNKNVVLQVHHTYYKKNKNPWEYPNYSLITLCEFCHERVHHLLNNKENTYYNISVFWGISLIDFLKLEDRLMTMIKQRGDIDPAILLITSQIITREQI